MSQPLMDNYKGLFFRPAALHFSVDPETSFLLGIKNSEKFKNGWHITITWTRPEDGIRVKWRANPQGPFPLEYYEYFESLRGSFENNQCTFDVPPVDTLVFEYKFVAKLPQ